MINWNREFQKGVGDSGVPILCQGLAPYQSADWGKSRLNQNGTQIRPCYLTPSSIRLQPTRDVDEAW